MGLSALAYLRHKGLRPHTDWRKVGLLQALTLLCWVIKHNYSYNLQCNMSAVLFVTASINFTWNEYLLLMSAMFVFVEIPSTECAQVFKYKLVNCYCCHGEVIRPNLPHVFWVGLSGEWGGSCWLSGEKWPWSIPTWSLPGQTVGRVGEGRGGGKQDIRDRPNKQTCQP